jgi:hypothetical protein
LEGAAGKSAFVVLGIIAYQGRRIVEDLVEGFYCDSVDEPYEGRGSENSWRATSSAILAQDQPMSPSFSELLKLPASERAELAMALWESLSEAEREGELELTPEEAAEQFLEESPARGAGCAKAHCGSNSIVDVLCTLSMMTGSSRAGASRSSHSLQ